MLPFVSFTRQSDDHLLKRATKSSSLKYGQALANNIAAAITALNAAQRAEVLPPMQTLQRRQSAVA